MSIRRVRSAIGIVCGIAGVFLCAAGCGGDGEMAKTSSTPDSTDIGLIQNMFTEAATRWHYGDKAVLYDLEFEYVQDKHTFDEYLDFDQIKHLEADTLDAIEVKRVTFFDRDSAHVTADAIFVGPTGDTTHFVDQNVYRVYYHRGRWIHPTAGAIAFQVEYDDLQRAADSAAAAEAELGDF